MIYGDIEYKREINKLSIRAKKQALIQLDYLIAKCRDQLSEYKTVKRILVKELKKT